MARAIISPQFCSPYPVDLRIVRQLLSSGLTVKDMNGNTVFKVKEAQLSLRNRRVLVDAAGYPIITLQKKLMSAHNRWKVFRGDSTDSRNLVFSVKQSAMLQFKTKLHVFLANNKGEYAPDFKVKGNWFDHSCVVYAGKYKSSNIIASMHKKATVTSMLFGKDNFMVTVYPGMDHAFIVALIVILAELNTGGSGSGDGSE